MAQRWFVYMLECKGGKVYTGVAVDVAARFAAHRRGKGAAYTRANPPLSILASRRCTDRSRALKLEHALKQLTPPEKRAWAAKQRRAVMPARRQTAGAARKRRRKRAG